EQEDEHPHPTVIIGQLPTLIVEEGGRPTPEAWDLFRDKLEFFFRVNRVPAQRRRDWLLNCPGDYIIKTLKKLKSNRDEFLALTFDDAMTLLSTHIEPPKSLFFSRSELNCRMQHKGESIREYTAELCKLAASCDFAAEKFNLEVLCVLIRNMHNLELQQKLWGQADLTLDSAIRQIEACETTVGYLCKMRSGNNVQVINKAHHYRAELQGRPSKPPQQQQQPRGGQTRGARVQPPPRVSQQQATRVREAGAGGGSTSRHLKCMRCDRGRHSPDVCRFKTATCNYCGILGHIKPACRKYKGDIANRHSNPQRVQNVREEQSETVDYWDNVDWCLSMQEESVLPIYNVTSRDNVDIPKPCLILIEINNIPVKMEIDSGSGVSLIGRDIYDSCFSDVPLLHTPQHSLKAWNSTTLPVAGQIEVTASLGRHSAQLPLLIMASPGPSLLGRQWFSALGIQPPTPVAPVHSASHEIADRPTALPEQLKDFGTCLFDSKLGTYTGPPEHVNLRNDAIPQFRRARPVALAVRDRASVAIDTLVGTVFRATNHSHWASPAVYVIKPSGDVRVCVDYSSTVNAHIDRDIYPLPSVDEILTRFSGQSYFTKLDLKNAFLQLTVDDETSRVLTVNTHKGLYNEGGRPTPEAWDLFRDKLEFFFRVNRVPAQRRRDWLLNCPGDYIIKTLKKLKSNRDEFLALTFDDAMTLLSTHIEPPKSLFFSRSELNCRMQHKGESIREYTAELCKLAASCDFAAEKFNLEVLCVLIRNMHNLELQQKLWGQADLTLDSAIRQIEACETTVGYLCKMRSGNNVQVINKAHHYRAELQGRPSKPPQQQQQPRGGQTRGARVQPPPRVSQQQATRAREAGAGGGSTSRHLKCMRCDRGRHSPDMCRFKTATCNYCGILGHIKPACRKYKGDIANRHSNPQRVQNVREEQSETVDYWDNVDWCLSMQEESVLPIYNVTSRDNVDIPKPCLLVIEINNIPVKMEIDSGSGVSLIGRDIYDSCFSDVPLHTPQHSLKAWNSTTLPVAGQIEVTASLGRHSAQLPLLIMASPGPSLLGRQWFSALGIQPPTPVAPVHSASHETADRPTALPEQLKDFGTCLFDSKLGTYTGPPEHVNLRNDAIPQFRRARPVALAVRDRASVAIDTLVGTVFRATNHSHWASPAVYVIKPSGDVRVCVDYSSTVNAHIDRDIYPLPSVDEILTRFSGQSYFTKLDLKNAFLQLTVDDETSRVLTVNTHKGLLPPGLSNTPWQWTAVEEKAIQFVRDKLASPAVLCSFHIELPLFLATDACQHGLGCVLSHVIDGVERPIMYGSRSLTSAESRYSVIDLEATAVVFGLKDAAPSTPPEEPAIVMFKSSGPQATSVFAHEIARETLADPVLSQVMKAVECGTPRNKLPKEVRPYIVGPPGSLTVQEGCIIFGSRSVIPTSLRPKVLQCMHKFTLRTTSTESGQTPAELMLGRRLVTPFDRMNPNKILSSSFSSCEIAAWPVGMPIYYRQYLQKGGRGDKWLCVVIKGHEGSQILTIQCPDGAIARRHLDQVRRRSPREDADTHSCLQGEIDITAAGLAAAEAVLERIRKNPAPDCHTA
ncbi:hypothetical protein B566_EDAN018686, partial [Ephemera danica]